MTPGEVADLLRYCSSLDGWLKQTSPEEGAVMVAGWGTILEHVPADVAMSCARRHYSVEGARTIQPGDILGAWRDQLRVATREQDEGERRELAAAEFQEEVPVGSGAAYVREMLHAMSEGKDPGTVKRPAGVPVLTADQEERSRRCVYYSICACTHTECRGGFLDEEVTVVNGLGRKYPAVKRCPNCNDALLMAEERGIARKPRRR